MTTTHKALKLLSDIRSVILICGDANKASIRGDAYNAESAQQPAPAATERDPWSIQSDAAGQARTGENPLVEERPLLSNAESSAPAAPAAPKEKP